MSLETVLAFCGIALLAYVTPGPDWFVVMSHAVRSRRAGWVAAIGVQCGLLVHMTAAAIGVAAIVLASATAFTVLKLVGAAYLVYLGVRALLNSRSSSGSSVTETQEPADVRLFGVWRQSFVANVLNPKAALFFVAVLPQFVSTDGAVTLQILGLGVIDVALGVAWWALFVFGVHRLRTLMGGRRARVVTDRISGTALIGLGGGLALTPAKM
ncbi:lysine transporter LysE [Williamsia sp. 1138]|uniref:LysE family translocator n=1 Tax=Williamsia sp. 1138 TaxID=1903117 RepID=UPI000A1161A8|nr:LysE family translocator [Williamsia sp. 1138]OZG30744.1 lysine transporter LysE [Williamsia sp. 1138]